MLELNKIYNMDCLEGMKQFPDKYFDLAIVDPEYGRKEHGGKNRSKFVKQKNGSLMYVPGNKYIKKDWDNKPASEEYFAELFRVSKNQIIWGENYYYKNDTFEKAEKRLEDTLKAGFIPFAMLYKDEQGNEDHTWRKFQRQWARTIIIISNHKKMFPKKQR